MNNIFGTWYKVVVLSLIMSFLVEELAGFPIILRSRLRTNGPRLLKVSSTAEIEREVNQTFPKMLLSNLNPYEYLKQHGHGNVTGLDILPYLFLDQIPARRMRRNVDYQHTTTQQVKSCPVSWNVHMDNNRRPINIQKARCNGPGTLCKSSKGQPSCEEVKFELPIFTFLGEYKGTQIWQEGGLLIPVACTCQMYCR
eukprot:Seg1021.8 transcript_id=Seg1021.8/GoldUCD/mRNA.D3Y31 product="hypothetical protein" protein_id=Seg1021.8/GoldUCD/D3Y31